jgi:hypothetical protein
LLYRVVPQELTLLIDGVSDAARLSLVHIEDALVNTACRLRYALFKLQKRDSDQTLENCLRLRNRCSDSCRQPFVEHQRPIH